jgi:hypothetical protein
LRERNSSCLPMYHSKASTNSSNWQVFEKSIEQNDRILLLIWSWKKKLLNNRCRGPQSVRKTDVWMFSHTFFKTKSCRDNKNFFRETFHRNETFHEDKILLLNFFCQIKISFFSVFEVFRGKNDKMLS